MNKYFQEQLRMLHEGAREFARKYPAAAPMLLEQGGDPDAERILEGTAYLCAKIHERLDQTAPELIQTLLREVFPESVMPVPSMAVVRFALSPGFTEPLLVARGAQLASKPIGGVSCIYSTMRDVTVLPLSVSSVESETRSDMSGSVTLTLRAAAPLEKFLPDRLDFHLTGGYSLASQRLLALLTRLESINVSAGASSVELPSAALSILRSPLEDHRLPSGQAKNRAYAALVRYFCCPEQLTAFGVSGLKRLALTESARELKLTFRFGKGMTPPPFTDGAFAVNTVAACNVFQLHSEPIQADFTHEEYRIYPHVKEKQYVDILGVTGVTAIRRGGRAERCRPYGLYNESRDGLIYNIRYTMPEEGELPEHYISMPRRPDSEGGFDGCVISMDLICCNRGLPNRLLQGDICMPTDATPSKVTFENITAPSPMLAPPADEGLQWRFLAHMNANLLPLASAKALQQTLSLYVPRGGDAPELSVACAKKCQSVRAFSSCDEERLFHGRVFRGRRLSLELEPSGFVSHGDLWLFADSLDQFLAEFAPINTYTRLVLTVSGTDEKWEWAPRLGNRQLI
ncbi:type VI secretion system baseplate subunit TssF [uncultured Cloacibacillus sp.]|uniref:type VI secretion system baseplate subunit TssF n=1 Tax=uncultured Cloacibacillus sp. TaxID=889794 RepID=UPI002622D731|nr:type VI secretion system baseplate subunit TssF [uncultured Cloacibacillus sp.]